jgi:hypothetical protein
VINDVTISDQIPALFDVRQLNADGLGAVPTALTNKVAQRLNVAPRTDSTAHGTTLINEFPRTRRPRNPVAPVSKTGIAVLPVLLLIAEIHPVVIRNQSAES